MLDHWGLSRQSGEDFWAYLDRILASPVFSSDNEDLSPFDLSPAGAVKVAFFSFVCDP